MSVQTCYHQHAFVVLDGALIPVDRVTADRPFYSGMHRSVIQRTPRAACPRRRYQCWAFVLMLHLLARSSVVALFALGPRYTYAECPRALR